MSSWYEKDRRIVPQVQGPKKPIPKDQRLTNCSECKFGIFERHNYKWTGKGLVHVNCNNPESFDET